MEDGTYSPGLEAPLPYGSGSERTGELGDSTLAGIGRLLRNFTRKPSYPDRLLSESGGILGAGAETLPHGSGPADGAEGPLPPGVGCTIPPNKQPPQGTGTGVIFDMIEYVKDAVSLTWRLLGRPNSRLPGHRSVLKVRL